jgi:hypothetical protein
MVCGRSVSVDCGPGSEWPRWNEYARAAAVGSSRMSSTSSPAIRPAARVVEVRGDRDDRLRDRPEPEFGVLDQLPQDDRRERLRAEVAAGDRAAERFEPHAPLDQRRDPIRLLLGDIQRRLADDRGTVFEQEDGRRREHVAVAVREGDGVPAVVQGGDRGVRRAQVDADDLHEETVGKGMTGLPR